MHGVSLICNNCGSQCPTSGGNLAYERGQGHDNYAASRRVHLTVEVSHTRDGRLIRGKVRLPSSNAPAFCLVSAIKPFIRTFWSRSPLDGVSAHDTTSAPPIVAKKSTMLAKHCLPSCTTPAQRAEHRGLQLVISPRFMPTKDLGISPQHSAALLFSPMTDFTIGGCWGGGACRVPGSPMPRMRLLWEVFWGPRK